ncbi:MAG: Rab family GTPase [Candidatus Hodarchaeales archaeon]|jgi:GTPase SAR1 family protein
MTKENEFLLKICILSRNSEISSQFGRLIATGFFDKDYSPTLGVDIPTRKIIVNGDTIKLIIVITRGEEFFGKLRPNYYRGASAAILLFDKGDRKSFEGISDLLNEFKQHIPHKVPITLVGVKTGSEKISKEEGQQLAQELELHYFESYPISKIRVLRIFKFLARKVIKL